MGVCKCPFCHEPLEFQSVAWVACGGCLARHHASCWAESPRCATCGDGRSLSLPPSPRRRGWPRRLAAGVARVAAVLLLATGPAVLSVLWLSPRCPEVTVVAPPVAPNLDEPFRAQTKRLEKLVAGLEKEDRTGEVLERLERVEATTKKRLEALGAEVAQLRRIAPPAPAPQSVVGMSVAVEQLAALEKDRYLTASQRDQAKRAVLASKLSPEAVAEVTRFARLKEGNVLTPAEFDRLRRDLLEK